MAKAKNWLKPAFDFDDDPARKIMKIETSYINDNEKYPLQRKSKVESNFGAVSSKTCLKYFDPIVVEDLAVNSKKVSEVEEFLIKQNNKGNIMLLSGPVGCGKTITVKTLAGKHNFKVTEWITPMDLDHYSENGQFEYREKQSTKFLEFIINAANFTSLLDNNTNKIVLVEDFPNTFMRTHSEFSDVLFEYKQRAKSPIIFICSDGHTNNKNAFLNLFTPGIKEQFNIQHILFNSVSATGLRTALKRVTEIIRQKFTASHNIPTTDLIECVLNSSAGDVRSAVLNLHFACLKGSHQNLQTSFFLDKNTKTKSTKKKQKSSKFSFLGKNETVSLLHGVGRVLNPKVLSSDCGDIKLSHSPKDVIEQFISQPISFINFLEENYLSHFSNIYHADQAASSISIADFMLAEWREKMCQEYGLYLAVAGLMLSNKNPVSAWNPVRGPKNMMIKYPTPQEIPQLEQNILYKGKVLVSDYSTYCKIIGSNLEISKCK